MPIDGSRLEWEWDVDLGWAWVGLGRIGLGQIGMWHGRFYLPVWQVYKSFCHSTAASPTPVRVSVCVLITFGLHFGKVAPQN